MSFQFRFQSIERLRLRERDIAAAAVTEVLRAIEILDQNKKELQEEIDRLDSQRQSVLIGNINVNQLVAIQRYQLLLVGQIQHLDQQRETLFNEQRKREAVLLEKQKGLKSIEKLREHQKVESETLNASRQQSRLDEWSTNRTARN